MPTALIAEDEPMLRAQLKARLSEAWPELGDIVEAENGDLALALIDERRPDVAFLDIRMPRQSGLDVARAIAGRCHVVFVTAYDEYAIAAFDEGAIDYVLKPVTADRIGKVVARIKARLATPPLDLAALLAKLAAREESAAPLRWIRASLGNVMQMIAVVDVVYFQAEDKYTKVVTRDSAALIRKPIKDLYDELDQEAFWQIHRATIVNLQAIARVERDFRDQPVITLKSRPEKLTVSRTFAHRFKAM
ncbi:MAG TPA: LytTR family DNA-binding domain-containing protein [Casimicrobiaceae bacterium]|jgi:DNA-binding LytR/AlgR family response regulator|nr:LytTR family DNA-binding domain-containing protein [Casimicrobiaceae bacterium]